MRIRLLPSVVVLFLLFAALSAGAAPRYDFRDTTLENGLRVITLEDMSCPIVAVQVWYRVGSKDERPDRQGFAHMFEHMMFRGTELLEPEEHFELIRRTGGNTNAFTSFDYTAYVNELPANQLELALWLEAERMMFLNVDQENFETERNVVKEERRQNLNEPYGTVYDRVLPVIFEQHPYQWPPIGRLDHLHRARLHELQEFWDRFYIPDNAILVIVGAVSHEDAQAAARRYFGWMPRGADEDRPRFAEPPQVEPREVTLEEPLGPAPLAGFIYRGVPASHPDNIPLELLMGVLGRGESSRLYRDLVQERKVSTQVVADTFVLEDDGIFGAGAALLPGRDLEPSLEAIEGHLRAVTETPVSDSELDKVRVQLRRDIVTGMLTVANKARLIGRTTILHGSPDWLNEQLDVIDAVTPQDLRRVAAEYIAPERRTTLRVLPAATRERPHFPELDEPPAEPETAPAPERAGPKVGAARPREYPTEPPMQSLLDTLPEAEIRERTLRNGLKVVVLPNHEVPFVTMLLGVKLGAFADPDDMPGLAAMAVDMLTQGTERYSAAELAELLDSNALTLGGRAELDVCRVDASCLSDKAPLALELLAEVVRRPVFPESEFEVLREQRLLSLEIRANDPNYLADRALRRELFGPHPYARTAVGELEDIARLDRERLAAWWGRHVRPDQCVLYIAGDVQPRRAFRLASRHFGDWRVAGPAPESALPDFPEARPSHIVLIDKPDSVQSQIRVGQISITRGHPDYHASRVFTQIYGGSFGSRLNRLIRVEKGLTYGAAGGILPMQRCGMFWTYTFTQTDTTAEAVRALLDTIRSMSETPSTDEELDTAKSYLVGSFAGGLETPQDFMAYQWIIEYNGLPADYLNGALEGYTATEREDISRIAREIVDDQRLVVVVVGDAAAIRDGLEEILPVTVIEAPAAEAEPDTGE